MHVEKKPVSIIIPIYNKEIYLRECMQSVLQQSFVDFELLCVNDCSTDNSLQILEGFAKADSRVRILNNEQNMGAADSRNRGISEAVGEYVLILDADDIFDRELVAVTYEKCKKEKLDVLFYDFETWDNVSGATKKYSMMLPMKKRLSQGTFSNKDITAFLFQLQTDAPWTKMCRRDFIIKNNLKFQKLSSCNDTYFGKMVMLQAEKIGYLDKCLIKYRCNAKFQISNNKIDGVFNFAKAVLAIKERMLETGVFEANKLSFYTYAFRLLLSFFYKSAVEIRMTKYEEVKALCKEIFGDKENESIFLNQYMNVWLRDFADTDIAEHLTKEVDNEYKYIFQNEIEKINALRIFCEKNQYQPVLWGYGKFGKQVAKECEKVSFVLDCIVDKNYEKFNDTRIQPPQVIQGKRYAILVPNAAYTNDILAEIENIKGESVVVDMQPYFVYGFSLDECIY